MINVVVKIKDGETHISITGHAGFAESGKDIVCAAVSAIAHTTIIGLDAVADAYPDNVHITISHG